MNQKTRTLIVTILLTLTGILNGCAVNPVSGNREIVLMSVEDEKKLGAEHALLVKEQMGLIDQPAATLAYVQAIGHRLARFSPYQQVDYQFHIVNSSVPNAFALPGGYVYVSRGLLVLANSEDELAGVIGHEIGHVAARHSVQRITRAAPIGVVTGITSAVAGIASPTLAAMISGSGNILNSAILAPYSREQENDADKIGQELAAKAGWNPEGISVFLKTLEREAALDGDEDQSVSFFSTHPATPERIEKTSLRATKISRQKDHPIAKNRREFLNKLNGLIVGPDTKQGVFVEQNFLHPTMNFALTFPTGWETTNQPQYVAAVNKKQDAMVVLQIQSKGNDPVYAARSFLSDINMDNRAVERLKIRGLPAARTVLYNPGEEAVLTWIAYQDQIFRLTGANKLTGTDYRQVFNQTVATFHPLTSEERAKIRQQRLRIVSAKAGEKISGLLKRVGSYWDDKKCAIANNLKASVSLIKGQLIKVAIPERL